MIIKRSPPFPSEEDTGEESLRLHIYDVWKRDISFLNSWSNLRKLVIVGHIMDPTKKGRPSPGEVVDFSSLNSSTIELLIVNASIFADVILPPLPNVRAIDVAGSRSTHFNLSRLSSCHRLPAPSFRPGAGSSRAAPRPPRSGPSGPSSVRRQARAPSG